MTLSFEKLKWLVRAWKYKLRVDPGEVGFLLDFLKPGDLAVDVGAYKGAYTYWMSRAVGRRGRVVAFEPQPMRARALDALTKRRRNIKVESLGVSSHRGSKLLVVPQGRPQEASLEIQKEGSGDRAHRIPITTLDWYFRDRERAIKLIKCDVEGHELSVFQGGEAILTEDRPALIFECENRHLQHGTVEDVFEYLQGIGYEGYFFEGRARRPLDRLQKNGVPHGDRSYIYNYLFLPNAK